MATLTKTTRVNYILVLDDAEANALDRYITLQGLVADPTARFNRTPAASPEELLSRRINREINSIQADVKQMRDLAIQRADSANMTAADRQVWENMIGKYGQP